MTLSFAILIIIIEMGWQTLLKSQDRLQIDRDGRYALVAYGVYWFTYFWFWTVAAHRTIGMAIFGLKVVDAQSGKNVTVIQGFLRTALLPLSAIVLPPLGILGLIRHDGSMIHDMITSTALIYKWNAAMAKFRSIATESDQHFVDDSPLLATSESDQHNQSSTMYSSLREHRRIV